MQIKVCDNCNECKILVRLYEKGDIETLKDEFTTVGYTKNNGAIGSWAKCSDVELEKKRIIAKLKSECKK